MTNCTPATGVVGVGVTVGVREGRGVCEAAEKAVLVEVGNAVMVGVWLAARGVTLSRLTEGMGSCDGVMAMGGKSNDMPMEVEVGKSVGPA
jgi:hypothetical protein